MVFDYRLLHSQIASFVHTVRFFPEAPLDFDGVGKLKDYFL